MSKTGRNDPCPCGSGMKYKKCCADKNAQAELIEQNVSASQDFYDDPLPYDNGEPEDPYPTISNEEQETVDKWWSVYHKLGNIDEIKIHLDLFLNQHPAKIYHFTHLAIEIVVIMH